LRQLSFDVCGLLFGQANSLSAINLRWTLSLSIPDHQATLSLPYHEATTGTALAISFNFLGAVSESLMTALPPPRAHGGYDEAIRGRE